MKAQQLTVAYSIILIISVVFLLLLVRHADYLDGKQLLGYKYGNIVRLEAQTHGVNVYIKVENEGIYFTRINDDITLKLGQYTKIAVYKRRLTGRRSNHLVQTL